MLLTTDPICTDNKLNLWKELWGNPWFASLIEVIFTLLVSNLAILIAVFVYMLGHPQTPGNTFWTVLVAVVNKNIKSTEIIVYILALIAPAIWIMFKHIRLWRHTGQLIFLLVLQIGVVLSTAIIFAMSMTDTLKNTNLANFWAYFCLIVALGAWYWTLVYQKKVIDSAWDKVERPKPGKESGSDVLAALRGQ
jgi:hypothetical protein